MNGLCSLGLVFVVLTFAAAGGCRWLMDDPAERAPVHAPPLKVTAPVKPVQPEEITAANARSAAQRLLEEIEQDEGKE
jgi:hypothetical protein